MGDAGKKIVRAFVGLILPGLVGFCASAYAADFKPNMTVLGSEVIYDVNADGTFTQEDTVSVRIDTDQGVKALSQMPLTYSPSMQGIEILDAYTTTPAGKRIDVAADRILEQQSAASAAAPMFNDRKVKTVVFPAVEIGATLTLHMRLTQKVALFPGQFFAKEVFSDAEPIKSARVTVHAPAALKLHIDAVDLKGGLISADDAGRQTWQWSIKNTQAQRSEQNAPARSDRSPRVVITTFPDLDALGRAYLERAEPQVAVTPAVEALANQVTAGVTDRRAQADALYRWVSMNIRYVAIFFGDGGVVPHSAQSILDARYGDCKDHVTLLEALLAVKGIKSSPVLVNLRGAYWVPEAAASPGAFNHVITYLPEFQLYADSTAAHAMFGVLPDVLSGKRALIADDGTGHAALVSLPLSSPQTSRVETKSRMSVDSEGNVKGTSVTTASGALDWSIRSAAASLPPGGEKEIAERVLATTGQSGSGSFSHNDARDLTQPFALSTQFELPAYAAVPGPGAMRVPRGLAALFDIAGACDAFGPEERKLPLIFSGRSMSETVELTLPDGVKVASVPEPLKLTSPFGTYTSSYSRTGQQITVTRSLEITTRGPVVEPADYPALRAMVLAIRRDLNTPLMY
ncbi:DUF3857 domain-containing protein [Paraburkholderia xenovorans]|uniref:DUF3857 domain-containing protein n=1 Tax=Paraburkholderia xenovorans TaxID=36873 RepID=UPI0038BB35E4